MKYYNACEDAFSYLKFCFACTPVCQGSWIRIHGPVSIQFLFPYWGNLLTIWGFYNFYKCHVVYIFYLIAYLMQWLICSLSGLLYSACIIKSNFILRSLCLMYIMHPFCRKLNSYIGGKVGRIKAGTTVSGVKLFNLNLM